MLFMCLCYLDNGGFRLVYLSARYGSFPTTNTFYVTAGMWGDSANKSPRQLTARLSVGADGRLVTSDLGDYPTTGYWAQVAKTTDAGATWSIVFEDFDSDLYPNDIHCYDASTCSFVMEGMGAPQVVTTTDGGATWSRFTDSRGSSLMTVRMHGPSEVWAVGGGDKGRMWHTTDMVTWEAYEMDAKLTEPVALLSVAFNGDKTIAYGTGALRSQVCSIHKFEF